MTSALPRVGIRTEPEWPETVKIPSVYCASSATNGEFVRFRWRRYGLRAKWELLLPGAPEPRLTGLRSGLQMRFPHCVTQRGAPLHSCHLQLLRWPDNGGTMPSENASFTPSSILFRPRRNPRNVRFLGLWWRRRVPPPGPIGLLRRSFIAIAGEPALLDIRV